MSSIVLLSITTILTILFPILSAPLSLFGLIFAKGKIRKCYGFLLALSLAIMAYIWIPDESMDLYRHQQQVRFLSDFDVGQLSVYIKSSLEPIHYLVKFIVAQIGDLGLLQFLVLLCGYFELFWMICDFAELKEIKRSEFLLLFLFAFISLRFVDFASGLWFNFALINTAMGIYLDFFKHKKYVQYGFYALAVFSHIGTLYMTIVMIIFSKFRIFRTVKLPVLISVFLLAFSFGSIVLFLNNIFGANSSSIMTMMNSMYNSYFINGDRFNDFYTGWSFYFRIASIALCFVLAFWHNRKNILNEYSSFLIYSMIFIVGTMINAEIFARYGYLMVLLSLPLITNFLRNSSSKKLRTFLIIFIVSLIILQIPRMYIQMETTGLARQIKQNLTNSMITIMN